MRGQLTSIFPALERTLDLGNIGPLILLTGYQVPAALRRTGAKRLETWLRNRKVRGAEDLAAAALEAAERQHTAVLGEKITARVIHTLAKEVMGLNAATPPPADLAAIVFHPETGLTRSDSSGYALRVPRGTPTEADPRVLSIAPALRGRFVGARSSAVCWAARLPGPLAEPSGSAGVRTVGAGRSSRWR